VTVRWSDGRQSLACGEILKNGGRFWGSGLEGSWGPARRPAGFIALIHQQVCCSRGLLVGVALIRTGVAAEGSQSARQEPNGLEVFWDPVKGRVKNWEGEAGMTKRCKFGRIGMFSVLLAS